MALRLAGHRLRSSILGAIGALGLAAVAAPGSAPAAYCAPDDPPDGGFYTTLRGAGGNNDLYVSAELGSGYTGAHEAMLRARGTRAGAWERLYVQCLGNRQIALRAANGKWVSAELDYTGAEYGMLRARASRIGAWERFRYRLIDGSHLGDSRFVLESVANTRLVSAELHYSDVSYAMLRARADEIGPWEIWSAQPLSTPTPTPPPAPTPAPAPAPNPPLLPVKREWREAVLEGLRESRSA